ncbi:MULTISPECIES: TetR/AcrR family transcriptional regulator [unclassified Pseudofrankia]|uniref:TetR/AcrR family transcriptional regulator n=1 Tax=unclassified Pseudofrankia TaxID=2994372 RepID=UPI000B33488C|nr:MULTISPECIES: TetR/AcrR family transcriptional regulator [unclassified Pseudofrankia]MDT3438461.1 TetR/AcrR family transcriptional regulator [Pseudofrankia sp. BMG5.37]
MTTSRRRELLEAAYGYVLQHGLVDLSLRPLADAIGSSTGVLRFVFGSKEGLVAALLERARADELRLMEVVPKDADLAVVAKAVWRWLADPSNVQILRLWVESYANSLIQPGGPWAGFAERTVRDWLELFEKGQHPGLARTSDGERQRSAVLAVLRGGLLDLLGTGDGPRVTSAVESAVDALTAPKLETLHG